MPIAEMMRDVDTNCFNIVDGMSDSEVKDVYGRVSSYNESDPEEIKNIFER